MKCKIGTVLFAVLLSGICAGTAPAEDIFSDRMERKQLSESTSNTPSLSEYDNVPEGLMMTLDDDPTEQAYGTPATELTLEEVMIAYRTGKHNNIGRNALRLAEKGNMEAAELVGILYKNGQGIEKDIAKSAEWMAKAADANRPLAQHHLGVMYFRGEGVTVDPVKALMWLHIAIVHYQEGAKKDRARKDRDSILMQLTRRDKERALQMAREWLDKKGEAHLLDLR